MRIKFNRGPMAGKISDTQDDYAREYIIRENLPYDWHSGEWEDTPFKHKEGSYMRSNVVLKSGIVVFEWMGWKNGGKAF